MAWTIAALLVLGLATAGVEIRRVARRRLVSTAILDVDRELLDELALLFLGGRDHDLSPGRFGRPARLARE